MGSASKITDNLKSYTVASLIPVLADSKKEERATSVLLAAFRLIPNFAFELLKAAGAPSGKKAKIRCFTEVVPKSKTVKFRPDGLVVINTGRSLWSAIVESKVGNASLDAAQIESYIGLAREIGCDAIITISNDYASLPTHHPVSISKTKLGKLGLFHFSWLSVVSTAALMIQKTDIKDREQNLILSELIRYFRHKTSGINLQTTMGASWRAVCEEVQRGEKLLKSSPEVEGAVNNWFQLTRFLSLKLSEAVGQMASLNLSRANAADPAARLKAGIEDLTSHQRLEEEFSIPDAAARVKIVADFARRSLCFSMKLRAPKDKKRVTAPINWITRQVPADARDVRLIVSWPGRTQSTSADLSIAREEPESLIPPASERQMPTFFEVARFVDLLSGFKGSKKMAEAAEVELIKFYGEVGQHLKEWQPIAPKVQKKPSQPPEEAAMISFSDAGSFWSSDNTVGVKHLYFDKSQD